MDLSATGARLDLLHESILPPKGTLEIASLDLRFPIVLRWSKGTECGVEFTGPALSISGDAETLACPPAGLHA
jgi:hypothetical protein